MPVTAQILRDIMTEARPIIERQMNDAKLIAGFREVIASNGGDWSALKALIKAHVEDENDDAGDGKRVKKILDKADCSSAYADMLGLANMNEKFFSARQSYADAKLVETVAAGLQTETGRKALVAALDVMIAVDEIADPETGEIIETQEFSDGMASGSEHLSADHVSPPASQAAMGGGSANREQGDVDGSAARAGYGGQSLPLAGQIESRTKANFVDGTASLAAREGEQVAAPFPHSTVATPAAIVEQPEAPNTSPATSGTNLTRPAFPAVSGDEPGIPSSAADGAKTDGAEPAHPGRADLASDHRCVKAEQVATKHQPKPHCLEPASCKLGFTTALCWKCNDARMKARAEV